VISSTRNPVYAKQKLSPLRPHGRLFPFLLVGFLITCAPGASRADSLEDAVRLLAQKASSLLVAHGKIGIRTRNLASLDPERISHLSLVVERELQTRGHKISQGDSAGASLTVTFSQNATSFLVIGELVENGQPHFLVESVALSTMPSTSPSSQKPTLLKELIWKQESPIVDLKLLGSVGEKPEHLAVLSPNALLLYEKKESEWALLKTFPIPRSGPRSRDPRGQLFQTREDATSRLSVGLPRLNCRIDLSGAISSATTDCTSNDNEELVGLAMLTAGPYLFDNAAKWDSSGNSFTGELYGESGIRLKIEPFYSASFLGLNPEKSDSLLISAGIDGRSRLFDKNLKQMESFANWGSELTAMPSDCGAGWIVLATARADWTDTDRITAFQLEEPAALLLDSSVDLPGPVLSLGPEQIPSEGDFTAGLRNGGLAIVRNLKTGEYEAYRISVACSR
jgi:hypothetical protein